MSNDQGDLVQYQIYRDAARAQTWGNKSNIDTLSGVGAGIANPFMISIYGRVLPQNGLAPGHYQDTVIVTLIY
ncbi:spore coat protein U domain-containing protein [Lelliottia jeotgali]